MSRLEPSDRIEGIVGASRDPDRHIARAVSAEQRVYILHSKGCLQSGRDLRLCPYSLALDAGIDPLSWVEDEAVVVAIDHGRLVPQIRPFHPTDTL
jgi:hypothetical protein